MPEIAAPLVQVTPDLIDFVDFKWLMATEGHRVDIQRLQSDTAYARGCIAVAAGSGSEWLRKAAGRLSGRTRDC